MDEKEKQIEPESLETLQERKQKLENTIISRRSFLGKAGSVIAAGALAHFVFIGKVHAGENVLQARRLDCAVGTCVTISGEQVCNQQYSCQISEDICLNSAAQGDTEPPPCTSDCLVPYVTDCFVGMFDAE